MHHMGRSGLCCGGFQALFQGRGGTVILWAGGRGLDKGENDTQNATMNAVNHVPHQWQEWTSWLQGALLWLFCSLGCRFGHSWYHQFFRDPLSLWVVKYNFSLKRVPPHAVHTVPQGVFVWLQPWAPVHMWRCKSPRQSVSMPGAKFCSGHNTQNTRVTQCAWCAGGCPKSRFPMQTSHRRLHCRFDFAGIISGGTISMATSPLLLAA